MNKVVISVFAFILLLSTWAFLFFTNKWYCLGDNMCWGDSQTNSLTWGVIMSYSDTGLNEALSRGDSVGLFFQANWCGNCKLLEDDLKIKGIPQNSTILVVDFDDQLTLREKYAVNNYHTLVVIDKDKNLVAKDSSWDYDTVYKLLQ